MTVKELIAKLQEMPLDADVSVEHPGPSGSYYYRDDEEMWIDVATLELQTERDVVLRAHKKEN